jgi:hypothetical protein
VLSVLTGVGVLIVTALILFAFAQVVDFMPFGTAFFWANLGVAVSLFVFVCGLSFALAVGARHWGKRVATAAFVTPLLGAVALGVLVSQPWTPAPRPGEFDADALLDPIRKRHDVLLIVDPGDPAVRALAELARATPEAVAPERVDEWGFNLAFGLVTLGPSGAEPPWSLRLAPTTDRTKVVEALAAIDSNRDALATETLGRAIRDLATPGRRVLQWRRGSTRTIAFFTEYLPTQRQLDGEVRWDEALRSLSLSWIFNIRYPRRPAFVTLYKRPAVEAFLQWTRWARSTKGIVAALFELTDLFDNLAFLSLNRFFYEDINLAERYQPHLKFHSTERFLPLDVNAYLASMRPSLCGAALFAPDSCARIKPHSIDVLNGADGYLKLTGDRRGGRDLPPDDPDSLQRLYYNVTRLGRRVFVDYWWFFRFNESPAYEGVTCLAGLSVVHGSCFDHQGDWEGITVTLREGEGMDGASVTYTGHEWPGYRYRWRTLRRWGSIAKDTHPLVYVARGSHASYPVPCARDCRQLDFRFKALGFEQRVPDGAHDGQKDWPWNDPRQCRGPCLYHLPSDFNGNPAGWNAYHGEWGSSACTFVLKACTRSKGPLAPSRQPRYNQPYRGEWGDEEEVERELRRWRASRGA